MLILMYMTLAKRSNGQAPGVKQDHAKIKCASPA